MSGLVPETGFAQGASGGGNVYDTSPTGLGLSPAYLAPGPNVTATASSTATTTVPAGVVLPYAGSVIPASWVTCDGTTFDGTNPTYAGLWAAIGTSYGGTGISSFKVPDLRGRMAVGLGTNADVSTLGNNDGQAVANRRPKHRTTNALGGASFSGTTGNDSPDHTHDANIHDTGNGYQVTGGGGGIDGQSVGVGQPPWNTFGASARHTHSFSGTTAAPSGSIGTNNANDALDAPSYIVLLYIIKL